MRREANENDQAKINLLGTGALKREFLCADDATGAIVLATERYEGGDPLNLGSETKITIDLLNLIAKLTGFNGSIEWVRESPTVSLADHSKPVRRGSCSALRQKQGL
jgi:GDP-L-fucose synthase